MEGSALSRPQEAESRLRGPRREVMLEVLLNELERGWPWKRDWKGLPELLDAVTMGELREKLHERLGEELSTLDCYSLQQIVKKLILSMISSDRLPEEKSFHLREMITWIDCGDRGLLKAGILEKLRYLPLGNCLSLLSTFPHLTSYGKETMKRMILGLPEEALTKVYTKLISAKL